jgi:hypothetical protein
MATMRPRLLLRGHDDLVKSIGAILVVAATTSSVAVVPESVGRRS